MNKFYIITSCLIILFSCQENEINITESPTNGSELFDTFWLQMNVKYVYWDIDNTKWDETYNQYKPLFAKLDLNQIADLNQAWHYFQEMTKGLIDCHYNITFHNTLTPKYIFNPSLSRKQKKSNFHQIFNYNKIDINYLDINYKIGNNNSLTTLCGTIEKRILFFSCSEFNLYEAYHSKTSNTAQKTLQFFFNKLHNSPNTIKGIIIDIRGNHGGNLGDLNFFVGHFIDKKLHFGYTQIKNGNGRLDYTPWIKAYVNPEPDGKKIDLPIIILADMYSASLAEAVLMAFKTFPKCIFIGETTWGATGPLIKNDIYNSGQFKIDNFLSVAAASCKFKYINGYIYEGIGYPPDILIPYDENSIISNKDKQLEKAISLIK